MLRQADDDIEASVALEQLAGGLAADGDLDHVLHFTGTEPIARERLPIELYRQDRKPCDLFRLHVGGAADGSDRGLDLPGRALKNIEVVAEDFDADITAYARDQFVDTKLNGLRDFVAAAG